MKTFKQIFIRSEADLPPKKKNSDVSIIVLGGTGEWVEYNFAVFRVRYCYLHKEWFDEKFNKVNVDWYLIEAPDNRDAIIEKLKEIIEHYKCFYDSQNSPAVKVIFPQWENYLINLESELSALEAPPEDK